MTKFNAVRAFTVRNAQRISAGALALVAAGSSMAQTVTLPSGATDMFTNTAAVFALILAAAYVLMLAITGGWITFDMVRKGAKKAAK